MKKKAPKTKIEQFMSTFPHILIGKGMHRIVFELNKDCVIKIPIEAWGLVCMNREIQIYQSSSSTIKKYLAKIVDHGKGWLIMERFDREIIESKKHRRQLSKVKEKFLEEGIISDDTTPRNLRRGKNGNIIIIDYGDFFIKNFHNESSP